MTSSYKNSKNDISYISFISQFEKYMITNDMYQKYNNISRKTNNEDTKTEKMEQNKNYNHNQIYIKEYDKLFWCFYLMLHDKDTYFSVDNKHFQIEKQLKIDLVDKIRNNKGLMKEAKLKIADVENNVVNDKKTDISGFQAFCIYYNLNVLVCYNNIYYNFYNDDDEATSVIYIKSNKFTCEKNINEYKINEIKNNYYLVDNPKKPLKSIGNYKIDDLIQLCKLFKIIYYDEHHKNFKKNKIYELVLDKMN